MAIRTRAKPAPAERTCAHAGKSRLHWRFRRDMLGYESRLDGSRFCEVLKILFPALWRRSRSCLCFCTEWLSGSFCLQFHGAQPQRRRRCRMYPLCIARLYARPRAGRTRHFGIPLPRLKKRGSDSIPASKRANSKRLPVPGKVARPCIFFTACSQASRSHLRRTRRSYSGSGFTAGRKSIAMATNARMAASWLSAAAGMAAGASWLHPLRARCRFPWEAARMT